MSRAIAMPPLRTRSETRLRLAAARAVRAFRPVTSDKHPAGMMIYHGVPWISDELNEARGALMELQAALEAK